MLVLKVLGEVHLVLGLVDGDKIPLGDGHHVHLLLLVLLHGHRPLPDADCDLVVGDGVSVLQRVDLQLLLVVLDHRAELPVGVGRVLDQSEISKDYINQPITAHLVPQGLLLLQDLRLLGAPLLSVFLQLLHFFDNVRPSPI